jgi:GTP cyclohydrolase III
MNDSYLAIDGDDVGRQLEYLILMNKREAVFEFSNTFKNAMNWLEARLVASFEAEIVFTGGDNLLACFSADKMTSKDFEEIREQFAKKSASTLSIGIGKSPRQAYFALKLAKTSGKDCVRHFQELTDD